MVELINNDCMKVMKTYKNNYFDLAIVDPPYGLPKNTYGSASKGILSNFNCQKYNHRKWDVKPTFEYTKELIRVSKNQIIWGANHFISIIPFDSSCWLVWDKDNGTTDFADCELAWTSFNTSVRKFNYRWNGMLQQDMKNKEKRIHPTQKPVALYKWILNNYAKKYDKILDTHLGSGSIAIACHDLGYDLTGIELEKEYYDAAVKRYNQYKSQLQIW